MNTELNIRFDGRRLAIPAEFAGAPEIRAARTYAEAKEALDSMTAKTKKSGNNPKKISAKKAERINSLQEVKLTRTEPPPPEIEPQPLTFTVQGFGTVTSCCEHVVISPQLVVVINSVGANFVAEFIPAASDNPIIIGYNGNSYNVLWKEVTFEALGHRFMLFIRT